MQKGLLEIHVCVCHPKKMGVSNFLENVYKNGIWQRVTHGTQSRQGNGIKYEYICIALNIYEPYHTVLCCLAHGTCRAWMTLNSGRGVETQAEQSNYKYKHLL